MSVNIVLALKSFYDDDYIVIEKTAKGTYDLLFCKSWYDSFTLVYNLGEIHNRDGVVNFGLELPKESNKIMEYGKSFPWPIKD